MAWGPLAPGLVPTGPGSNCTSSVRQICHSFREKMYNLDAAAEGLNMDDSGLSPCHQVLPLRSLGSLQQQLNGRVEALVFLVGHDNT